MCRQPRVRFIFLISFFFSFYNDAKCCIVPSVTSHLCRVREMPREESTPRCSSSFSPPPHDVSSAVRELFSVVLGLPTSDSRTLDLEPAVPSERAASARKKRPAVQPHSSLVPPRLNWTVKEKAQGKSDFSLPVTHRVNRNRSALCGLPPHRVSQI